MKILYLSPDYGIPVLGGKGGAIHIRSMVAAFARAGHQVVLAAPRSTQSAWEAPAPLAGQFVQIPVSEAASETLHSVDTYMARMGAEGSLPRDVLRMIYDLELEAALLRLFEKRQPDCIYTRAALFSTAALALARKTGRPLLVELNAPLAAEQAQYRGGALSDLALQAERQLLSQADAVIVVSPPLREHAIALGVAPERVHVFPNGIDPTEFCPGKRDAELRRRLGLGEGPVLGFVGGLRPWHGVEVLPELLARVNVRHPQAQLLIVGDGPMRGQLEEALEKRGLRDRAVLTGLLSHDGMPAVIRQFDVALAPYPDLDHGFYFSPLKLFEYMGCGVPVAAPRCGQIGEVLRDGETGLLYSAGNLDELAGACDRLLADPELRHQLGAAAAREARENYVWDRNAARAAELAGRLAEKRG